MSLIKEVVLPQALFVTLKGVALDESRPPVLTMDADDSRDHFYFAGTKCVLANDDEQLTAAQVLAKPNIVYLERLIVATLKRRKDLPMWFNLTIAPKADISSVNIALTAWKGAAAFSMPTSATVAELVVAIEAKL